MLRDRFDPRYFERDVLFRYHAGWAEFTHSRNSPATYFDRTGTLREVGPDVPRVEWLDSATPAVLLEGAGTNGIRNPRGEGAMPGTLGSGGALPTFWDLDTPAGLTWEVVATGVEDGLPYVDVRLHGTPSQTFAQMRFDGATAIAAAPGETWTGSCYVRRVGGSMAGIGEVRVRIQERDASGEFFRQSQSAFDPDDAPRLASARRVHTHTVSDPTSVAIVLMFGMSGMTVGTPVDVTFRIGAPQLERTLSEQMPFATSLILPPVGAPAASVRAVDWLSHPLAGLRSCAVYARGEERGNVMLSGFPRVWQWGGGVAGNVRVVCNAGTYGITLSPTSGGSVSRSLTTAPAVGQGFELIAQVELTDGAVRGRLIQSIEGGPVEDTGWSVPVPADFAPATLYVGARDGGDDAGILAVRDLLVLDGADWTMDAVRRLLPW